MSRKFRGMGYDRGTWAENVYTCRPSDLRQGKRGKTRARTVIKQAELNATKRVPKPVTLAPLDWDPEK